MSLFSLIVYLVRFNTKRGGATINNEDKRILDKKKC